MAIDKPDDWGDRIGYLADWNRLYYNDDYLQFLVERVWRVDRPVQAIDCGCGFGHLGLRLLPLLPKGSTYTGIDASERLIGHARERFAGLPYQAEFRIGNLLELEADPLYDIALCHAVLLHMTDPAAAIAAMAGGVKDGGLIAAFEPYWIGSMAGYAVDGVRQSDVVPLGTLQRLYEADEARTGKDGNIGLKLPLQFRRLGLRGVQCRVSDRVNVLEAGEELYDIARMRDPGDREAFVERLAARGLERAEAERQHEAERRMATAFDDHAALVYAPTMSVTFGTVDRQSMAESRDRNERRLR